MWKALNYSKTVQQMHLSLLIKTMDLHYVDGIIWSRHCFPDVYYKCGTCFAQGSKKVLVFAEWSLRSRPVQPFREHDIKHRREDKSRKISYTIHWDKYNRSKYFKITRMEED